MAPAQAATPATPGQPTKGPSIPDLIVAAAAELAGLVVLHFDKDFDLIAMVTGQPVERIAVSGSESR